MVSTLIAAMSCSSLIFLVTRQAASARSMMVPACRRWCSRLKARARSALDRRAPVSSEGAGGMGAQQPRADLRVGGEQRAEVPAPAGRRQRLALHHLVGGLAREP